MAQPVAETGKAGDLGSAQGQVAGSRSAEDVEGSRGMEEFMNTGRTGRRNAVPDIAGEKGGAAGYAASELTMEMANLSCAEGREQQPPSQKSQPPSQAGNPSS